MPQMYQRPHQWLVAIQSKKMTQMYLRKCPDDDNITVKLDNVDDRKDSSQSMNEHAGVLPRSFVPSYQTVHFVLPDCIEETTKLDWFRHQLKQNKSRCNMCGADYIKLTTTTPSFKRRKGNCLSSWVWAKLLLGASVLTTPWIRWPVQAAM